MKRTLSNVVLECDTPQELLAAQKFLQEYEFNYEVFENLNRIEIYETFTPQEWDNLITELENLKYDPYYTRR